MTDPNQAESQAPAEEVQEQDLFELAVAEYEKEPSKREQAKQMLTPVFELFVERAETLPADVQDAINSLIREIDERVSRQLNKIMHASEFQDLEARWRGLRYLLDHTETGPELKIRVLNVSKNELLRDLQTAPEFDQSAFFKKVYSEEYDQFGGQPYGALLGDFQFGRSGQDIELLEKISNVAAAAHAPFLTGASPSLLGLESFSDLHHPRDLSQIFESVDYAKWKAFRNTEDSRYVALTLPRMLIREPYGPDNPIEEFLYDEQVDGTEHSDYAWANAAWGLGAKVNEAFAQYGWASTIRGVESGGLVQGLPVHTFTTEAGERLMKCPTETAITDRRENELAKLGFVGLVHEKDTPNAVFFSAQSAQLPKEYEGSDHANASARLSANIPYIFCASRFAHYMKCMMRDKIGSKMSRSQIHKYLNDWINNYVVANDDAAEDVKARRPLKAAQIEVEEIPGKPGAYRAVANMVPHFMVEEININLRLVADLPSG